MSLNCQYPLPPRLSSLLFLLERPRQLAHNTAPDRQHADHKNGASDDRHRFADGLEPIEASGGGAQVAEVAELVLKHLTVKAPITGPSTVLMSPGRVIGT